MKLLWIISSVGVNRQRQLEAAQLFASTSQDSLNSVVPIGEPGRQVHVGHVELRLRQRVRALRRHRKYKNQRKLGNTEVQCYLTYNRWIRFQYKVSISSADSFLFFLTSVNFSKCWISTLRQSPDWWWSILTDGDPSSVWSFSQRLSFLNLLFQNRSHAVNAVMTRGVSSFHSCRLLLFSFLTDDIIFTTWQCSPYWCKTNRPSTDCSCIAGIRMLPCYRWEQVDRFQPFVRCTNNVCNQEQYLF